MKKTFKYVFCLICFCACFVSLFFSSAFSKNIAKAENAPLNFIYNTTEDEQEKITIICKIDENRSITLVKNKSEMFHLPTAEEYLPDEKYLNGWKDENGNIFSTKQFLVLGADKTFSAMIENKCVVKISNSDNKFFVIPGEKFALPEFKDEYNKKGFIIKGYKANGKVYQPGQEIVINQDITIGVKYVLTTQNIVLICCISALIISSISVSWILIAKKRKQKNIN